MMKKLKKIWNFIKFVEQERINAMVHCGKAWW